ncbi:MAG TPA: LacI family DNA-binding transcriptional regulator [Terrimicrobium sp.]
MTPPITTHDIAREAGVSRTTVSYVLSDRPGISVSSGTRKRVLNTARRLGYVSNSAAEMLVTGRSRSIGVVLSRPELISEDGFIPIMIYGLNEVCRARGYRLLMEAVHDPPGIDDYLDLAKSKRIDGMIVINPRKGDAALRKVVESKFPVLVSGSSERPEESAIATRECGASRQVTSHLISLGHRRIAHIAHASLHYVAVHRRLRGYRAALRAANLPFEKALFVEGDFTSESGYRAMKQILASKAHPTALFAGNDTIAIGAMLAVREAGLSIPEDFAVAGYDDLPIAAYACPPLTTVRTHAFMQGKLLAEAAIGLVDKERIGSQQDVLPLELIVRESCGAKRKGISPEPEKDRRTSRTSRLTFAAMAPAVEL